MMRLSRRARFRLITLMLMVAIAGTLFGWLASERKARVAHLSVEFQRREERVRWAQQMQGLGYLSKAVLTDAENQREATRWHLSLLGASSEN